MSARNAASGGGDRAGGEPAEDVLVEENQCSSMSLPGLMTPSSAAGMSLSMEMPRKRKGSMDNQDRKTASTSDADMEDDQRGSDGEDQHVKIKCFREPHSQIEKRRRDKMNNLIDKLSAMIPTCNPMSRKLDKLTVLRMAVQHLKSLKGSGSSFSEASYKPSFLPDEELKHLVLKAADGFLFVVGCDRGKIVFVSESVTKILNYSRAELIGQSLFDYIHPKDMGKVKEQLSASELYPRERLIDAKTGLQVQADLPVGASRLCSGARRSFFCRMKYNKISVKVEEKEFQASTSKKKESQKYCTVHCTGYMRSWPTSQLGAEGEGEADKQDSSHFSCLVAVGRIHSHSSPQVNGEVRVKPTEFITRYAMDGKFTFVDQRATTILGYLPQELLGTSCYEYFHQDDLPHLADRHRKVLRTKEKIETNCYKFKTKHGSFVTLQSQWFSFVNPWTKEVEYIVSTNTVISYDHSRTSLGNKSEQSSNSKTSEDGKKSLPIIPGISTTPGAMIYAGSIGTQIANELLDFNRMNSSPSSGSVSPFSLPQDKCQQTHQFTNNVPNGEATDMEVPGKSSSEDEPQGAAFSGGEALMGENSQLDLESVVGPGLTSFSNDEAAMAVIMSLLETDTNLGEAVRPNSLSVTAAGELGLWTSQGDAQVKLRMGDTGLAAETPLTVNQMFTSAVERFGDCLALSWKEGEQQKTLNYRNYYESCRTAAKSFLKLGLQRYHGVGILGFNSAEWFIADIGAILAGGFAVGIYTTNSPEACQYVAENCKANIIVVENHKQLQKILQVEDKLPHLKAIIQYKDALKEKRPNLYTWAEFMELGRDEPDEPLDAIISSQKPNQCCTLIYTSGTTGQPKGVMLSHDNLTWTALSTSRHVRLTDATQAQESVVSYLPLSHVAAQMVDIWVTMRVGGATYFAQPDALKGSLVNTLKEVRPTAFMGVPRVWEKMQEKMKSVGAKSSTVRRKVAAWAKDVGLQTNLTKMNHGAAGRPTFSYQIAKKLVFKKVRKALGLDRCSKCYTGAAPITKDTLEFFLSLDIPVYELYGMSESTGPHTISLPDAFRLTSCGKEIIGCKTKLHNPDEEGNGEICFWGRHIFMGYLNMPDKTEEALDADGWLHSGDLGKHDENGFLFITGRIKELIITAGGENIPPVPTEDAVKEAVPLISNAMLIGDKRKFLSMLLTIKSQVHAETGDPEDELTPEAVELCRKLGSNATRVSEIAGGRDRVIHTAIQEGINRVNEKAISNAQRIQKWIILDRDFSISGGELGPTMKLKRPVVAKMYKEQIENFYKELATPTTPDNPLPPK